MTKTRYEFNENNSGGDWWLSRNQYDSLLMAGWELDKEGVEAYESGSLDTEDVPWGWRHNLYLMADSIQEAIDSWETATGENFFEKGCPCCGAPFSISGGGKYASGNQRPW